MSYFEVYDYLKQKSQKYLWLTSREIHEGMEKETSLSTTTKALNSLKKLNLVEMKTTGRIHNTPYYRLKGKKRNKFVFWRKK